MHLEQRGDGKEMDLFYSESSASDEAHGAASGGPEVPGASAPQQPSAGTQVIALPTAGDGLLVQGMRDATIDTASWQRWLESLGFSHREAASLIFERVRPRDEGLVRN